MTMINTKEAKSIYTPDNKAQEAVWLHGCNVDQVSMIEDLIQNKPEAEICCSKPNDKGCGTPFQLMGLYIKGEVTLMSRTDIGSKYDLVSGERSFRGSISTEDADKIFVKNYEDLSVITEGHGYTEAFVKPRQILGVWVCGFAYNKDDMRAKILKKKCEKLIARGYSIEVI